MNTNDKLEADDIDLSMKQSDYGAKLSMTKISQFYTVNDTVVTIYTP